MVESNAHPTSFCDWNDEEQNDAICPLTNMHRIVEVMG